MMALEISKLIEVKRVRSFVLVCLASETWVLV